MEYHPRKGKMADTQRRERGKLVDAEGKAVNITAQKYLLMLVHALTLFEADEI